MENIVPVDWGDGSATEDFNSEKLALCSISMKKLDFILFLSLDNIVLRAFILDIMKLIEIK